MNQLIGHVSLLRRRDAPLLTNLSDRLLSEDPETAEKPQKL